MGWTNLQVTQEVELAGSAKGKHTGKKSAAGAEEFEGYQAPMLISQATLPMNLHTCEGATKMRDERDVSRLYTRA